MRLGHLRNIFLLIILGSLTPCSFAEGNACSPWPAIDALGRQLPLSEEVGPPQTHRWVGIFYFLWHNEPGVISPLGGPYDISRILAREPDALKKP